MLQAPGSELRRKPVLHRTTLLCRTTPGTGKPVPLPYYKKTFGLIRCLCLKVTVNMQ